MPNKSPSPCHASPYKLIYGGSFDFSLNTLPNHPCLGPTQRTSLQSIGPGTGWRLAEESRLRSQWLCCCQQGSCIQLANAWYLCLLIDSTIHVEMLAVQFTGVLMWDRMTAQVTAPQRQLSLHANCASCATHWESDPAQYFL